MWNNAVLDVHTGLLTAFRPLAATAHEYPMTTVGIALLFSLLIAMLAAEITDGRAIAAWIGEAQPTQLER